MFSAVSILLPFQSDNAARNLNFQWIVAYYKTMFPDAQLCISGSTQLPFSRSQAINRAAKQATRDIFVIADVDMIYEPALLIDSMNQLNKDTWIIPYNKIMMLSEHDTGIILNTEPAWPLKTELTDSKLSRISKHGPVGGLNIITRRQFMKVGGFDERFIGWGGEDNAFSDAVNTVCGHYKRLHHTVYHLWHPRYDFSSNPNAENNLMLRNKYFRASGNKKRMKKLLTKSESVIKMDKIQ